MKCVTIHHNNILHSEGEYSENYSFRGIKFLCFNTFNRLWRGSKNQRVLFSAHRRSKSKSRSMQEVGEIQ